jgi:cytochrome P450 family 49 subfamily A
LVFLIQALASHQDIQEKLRKEIQENFDVNDENLELEKIEKCTYLSQVIKENMRLYGIVPGITKEAKKDTILGDYKIPKGQSVMIHMYSIHNSEEYFENPEKFIPERWEKGSEETENKKKQYWM